MRTLELVIPGLLGPVPDVEAAAGLLPAMPALARLLARGDAERVRAQEMETELCREIFGLQADPPPFAALARLGESGPAPERGAAWIRLDPLHLRIDMTHARAFGPPLLTLGPEEADALVASLNEHLLADGLELAAHAPQRWYLALEAPPALVTHTPSEVAGRNVDHFLPGGEEGPRWRGLMNELQMLLHDHPVNAARGARGELPVNSVWPWGPGALPRVAPAHPPAEVLADEPLARGLARLAGSHDAELPGDLDATQFKDGRTILVDTAVRDPLVHGEAEGWLAALSAVETRWLAPALEQLRRGGLDAVVLHTASAWRYRLGRRALRYRFWRRDRAWSESLEKGS